VKCPLFAIASKEQERRGFLTHIDCIKEECAWWLEDIGMCAIRDLALELRYTQFRILDIKDRMPHQEQKGK